MSHSQTLAWLQVIVPKQVGVCFTTHARNQAKSVHKEGWAYTTSWAHTTYSMAHVAVSADEVGCCCLNTLLLQSFHALGPRQRSMYVGVT